MTKFQKLVELLWVWEINDYLYDLGSASYHEIEGYLRGDHYGDCTQDSCPCLHCIADHVFYKAKKIARICGIEEV